MANRTVQITGYGFGSTPASLVATFNGTAVYTGTVPTSNEAVPAMPNPDIINDTTVLFTFEIPVETDGLQEMTIQVTNGTVVFANVLANQVKLVQKGTPNTYVSGGPTDFRTISASYDWQNPVDPPIEDPRLNVTINGVAQTPDLSDLPGAWWWTVNSTATLGYDLDVVAGMV